MLVISFLAGFGGITFELVIFKILAVQLGTANLALTLVLSLFMAGMGSGMYFLGKSQHYLFQSVRGVRFFLFLTGISTLTSPWLMGSLDHYFFLSWGYTPFFIEIVLSLMLLFVPAFFIGTSIPLLYRISVRGGEKRSFIGNVYGWHTIGGVFGALLTTFYCIPRWGISLTTLLSSLCFFGSFCLCIFLNFPEKVKQNQETVVKQLAHSAVFSRDYLWKLALGIGFCGMGLEVIWVRLLSIFLPNRNYSFGLILAVYLLGYGLGSLLLPKILDRFSYPRKIVFTIAALLGALPLVTVFFTRYLPDILFHLRFYLLSPWKQIFLPPLFFSSLIVFPATLLMGMFLPALVIQYDIERRETGRDVGAVFGANILGSVLGILATTYLFIPKVGLLPSNLLYGVVYSSIAGVILLRSGQHRVHPLSAVVISVLLLAGFSGMMFYEFLPKPLPVSVSRTTDRDDELLFYRESPEGTISLIEDKKTGVRWSYINNSAVCGTTYDALKVVKVLAHLPLLAHPAPKEVLVIGFGLGVTAGHVLAYPVDSVDCVELCPDLTDAAPFYKHFNRDVINDNRISMHAGDGRMFLKTRKKKYDVITCDPTHPALGSGNLYTLEYMELIKSRLNHGGIFVQYIPLKYLTPEELKKALATFYQTFPDNASLWLGYSHAALLGSLDKIQIDPLEWEKKLSINKARRELLKSSLAHVSDWLAILMMGPDQLKIFCQGVEPVSDNRPILEYPAFDSLHPFTWAENLASISTLRNKEIITQLLSEGNLSDLQRINVINRFYEAKTIMIEGQIARGKAQFKMAEKLFSQARIVNWDDREIITIHEHTKQILAQQRRNKFRTMQIMENQQEDR